MIAKHVLIGGFFTAAGLVTLLAPAIPFICIGALVFGPIELLFGLFAHSGGFDFGREHESPLRGRFFGNDIRLVDELGAELPTTASVPPAPLVTTELGSRIPEIRVATRKTTSAVYAVISFKGPPNHEVVAGYKGSIGMVKLDGFNFAEVRRRFAGGRSKSIDVPIDSELSRVLTIVFFGWAPHLEIWYDRQVIGRV